MQESEYYKSYFKIMAQYRKRPKRKRVRHEKESGKAQAAADNYYNANSRGIILCETAEGYLKSVLQKRFDPNRLPPITKWTQDREGVLAERQQLNLEYQTLKAEVNAAEKIRSEVYSIMARERRREQPTRKHSHDIEM